MNVLNILFVGWIVTVAAFTAVMVYRGHLNNHETDQLFLSDNADEALVEEHNAIVRKATFIQPFATGLGGAAAIMGVLVLGVYLFQQAPNMRF
jgi:hypothetical protein